MIEVGNRALRNSGRGELKCTLQWDFQVVTHESTRAVATYRVLIRNWDCIPCDPIVFVGRTSLVFDVLRIWAR